MISIIIPAYNAGATIKRAVDSVLKQNFEDWELILVDNNSLDDTYVIMSYYKKQFPHKIKLAQEIKRGAPAARNRGLMLAKGEWIQFLDSDDELPNDKLERQLKIAQQENAEIIVSNYVKLTTIGKFTFKKNIKPINDVWVGLIRTRLGITSSNLWKKESILKVGGWDESLKSTQEYDLLFRLLMNKVKITFDISPEPTLIYNNGVSITRTSDSTRNTDLYLAHLELRKRIRNYLIENNEFSDKIEELINLDTYNIYLYKKQYLGEKEKKDIECLKLSRIIKIKCFTEFQLKKAIKKIAVLF